MKVEKVEMMKCIKGQKVYPKGRVYTAPDIPDDVMAEVKAGAATVRVLTAIKTQPDIKAADLTAAPATSKKPETEDPFKDVSGEPTTENRTENQAKTYETFCEVCGAGPFTGARGLRMHRLNSKSCGEGQE